MYEENEIKYPAAEEKILKPSFRIDEELPEQQKNGEVRLGKVGILVQEHIKNNKPEMYSELSQKGILKKAVYEIQESIKQQMEQIEKQLRKENPPPKTENTIEICKYNQWVTDTTWDMVQDQIFFC